MWKAFLLDSVMSGQNPSQPISPQYWILGPYIVLSSSTVVKVSGLKKTQKSPCFSKMGVTNHDEKDPLQGHTTELPDLWKNSDHPDVSVEVTHWKEHLHLFVHYTWTANEGFVGWTVTQRSLSYTLIYMIFWGFWLCSTRSSHLFNPGSCESVCANCVKWFAKILLYANR